MSSIGSPSNAQASALQAMQAQHVAGKARDKEKADRASDRRSLKDQVELRVAGLETNTAVRQIPQNSSEQEREEHEAHDQTPSGKSKGKKSKKDRPRIDLKA